MAERLGMSLDECMERHTEGQQRMWDTYFAEELNRPGRIESYLMRVTAEIYSLRDQLRLMFAKKGEKPAEVKLEHFRVTFGEPAEARVKTPEEVSAAARARWTAGLGMPAIEQKVSRAEGERRGREVREEYESWQARWN